MTFDLQPTLVGPTLRLRPLEPADWEPLYAVAADPLIWALHPARDRHREPVFRRLFEESVACAGALAVLERSSDAIIGSSRYSFDFTEPGEVEIGWTFLARDFWGGSANREMKRLMLRHAFRFVDRAMFRIGEENLRSRRAMEKIGGKLTGRTQLAMVADREVIHVVYTIDRADFIGSPLDVAP